MSSTTKHHTAPEPGALWPALSLSKGLASETWDSRALCATPKTLLASGMSKSAQPSTTHKCDAICYVANTLMVKASQEANSQ
jgi:hypothetical protein